MLKIQWMLLAEHARYDAQGHGAKPSGSFPEAIARNGQPAVSVTMPETPGVYRLYCVIRNGRGGAAVGSLPMKVAAPVVRTRCVRNSGTRRVPDILPRRRGGSELPCSPLAGAA